MPNGRPWSPDDTSELRRLAKSGMTDAQIGERMGRDVKLIGRKRRDHQIESGASPAAKAIMSRINLRRMQRSYRDQ